MENLEYLTVKGVYKDTYNLYLKYYLIAESEEKWINLLEEMKQIQKRYNGCEIANDLCVALYKQLGHESQVSSRGDSLC